MKLILLSTTIMWKEIAIGMLTIAAVRSLLDVYVILEYKKIKTLFEQGKYDVVKQKSLSNLRIANFFSVGPWNKQIYAVYNGICWILASICIIEENEKGFLEHLGKIKKEENFEIKMFALALYYRAKGETKNAYKWFEKYVKSEHQDAECCIILKQIFEGTSSQEEVSKSIKTFKNPAIVQLLKNNGIKGLF